MPKLYHQSNHISIHIFTVESDNEIIDQRINKKKTKKLTRAELIAIKIYKWTAQNAASLEARHIESLKPKAKTVKRY